MGESQANLEELVAPIIRKHVPTIDNDNIPTSTRESSHGKYKSLTVTFTADSQEQLDNIYREVTALPSVLMVL